MHAFAWRWARAWRLPIARRKLLIELTATSGVLENLQFALDCIGLEAPLARDCRTLLAAAAGAGRLEVCRFLVSRTQFEWGFGDAILAAARAGQTDLVTWLLDLDFQRPAPRRVSNVVEWVQALFKAAAASGNVGLLAAVLMTRHARPPPGAASPGTERPLPRDWYPIALAAAAEAGREALVLRLLRPGLWRAPVPRPARLDGDLGPEAQLAYAAEAVRWETWVLEAAAEGCGLGCLQRVTGAVTAWQWPAHEVQSVEEGMAAAEDAAAGAAATLLAGAEAEDGAGGLDDRRDVAAEAAEAAAGACAWATKRAGPINAGKVLAAAVRSRTADWRRKAEWLESAARFRFPAACNSAALAAVGARPSSPDNPNQLQEHQQLKTAAELQEAALAGAVAASSRLSAAPGGDLRADEDDEDDDDDAFLIEDSSWGPGGEWAGGTGQQRRVVPYGMWDGRLRHRGCRCAGCCGAEAVGTSPAADVAPPPAGLGVVVSTAATLAAVADARASRPHQPLCSTERVSWLLARGLKPEGTSLAAAAMLPSCGGCGRDVLRLLLSATGTTSFPGSYSLALQALNNAGNVAWLLDVCRWEEAAGAAAALGAAAAAAPVRGTEDGFSGYVAPDTQAAASGPDAGEGGGDRGIVGGGGGGAGGSPLLREVTDALQDGNCLVSVSLAGQLQLVVWVLRAMHPAVMPPAPPMPARLDDDIIRPRQPRPPARPPPTEAEARAEAKAFWESVRRQYIEEAMMAALLTGDTEILEAHWRHGWPEVYSTERSVGRMCTSAASSGCVECLEWLANKGLVCKSRGPELYLLAAGLGDLATLAALRRLRHPVDWRALPEQVAAHLRTQQPLGLRKACPGAAKKGPLSGFLFGRQEDALEGAVNQWVRQAAKQEMAGLQPPTAELELQLQLQQRRAPALAESQAESQAGGGVAPPGPPVAGAGSGVRGSGGMRAGWLCCWRLEAV
ncbi:hypothetical protein HYH02_005165 [Chlamydomonas schloesseri]|uniref:Uncharacterized protein n=1 Tax=Chlamydomonas schloesseri TaxID=2026947 RepID=A0A836B752_9CHLO|nr:hypothetical protein HYH02_005165 [Chlamydomonas schloesseri]|eukprot:KAG2449632.1 hypothetical protein HYH02_005165 [Chlamydomonas schloesseri]